MMIPKLDAILARINAPTCFVIWQGVGFLDDLFYTELGSEARAMYFAQLKEDSGLRVFGVYRRDSTCEELPRPVASQSHHQPDSDGHSPE